MVDIPTREELYDKVDDLYHHHFPEAPYKLHATSAEHATWREMWLDIRDRTLVEEVNRIYWARFPDGPVKIDPDNPDHKRFTDGWLAIRDAINESAPMPPVGEDVDESAEEETVRTGVNQSVGTLLLEAPQFREVVDAACVTAVEVILAAAKDGRITRDSGVFSGAESEHTSTDDPPVKLKLQPKAWRYDDGTIHAFLE